MRSAKRSELDPAYFSKLQANIDPSFIEDALEQTGRASIRRRRFPAEQAIWLVLAMAIFRNRSIDEIVQALELAWPDWRGRKVSHSAVSSGRERLGVEPVQWLFQKTARKWAYESAERLAWRGLSVFGIDGTTVKVPDTSENREHFGKHSCQNGEAGYPQVRAVSLMALRSHLLADVRFRPFVGSSETALAAEFWDSLPDHSLVIADKYFFSSGVLAAHARRGKARYWLIRARKNLAWREVERLGKNDVIVEMNVSAAARKLDPSLPSKWRLRAITYKRPGFPPSVLLTSLLDPNEYPAEEIVALYHERWEIELGFNEIKRVMLEREETLRSKHPDNVYQELWGIALAYNLVRLEMNAAAQLADVHPVRLSFKGALMLVRDEMIWLSHSSPGAIPKRLRRLRESIAELVLPPRRSWRSYPRAVKQALSVYPSVTQAKRRAAKAKRAK